MISKYDFSQNYNDSINNFDKFNRVMNKKNSGSRGTNQKKLLNYGNESKKVVEKTFNTSGSGLKILTKQQMLSRLPILFAQIQSGNNSQLLKNELRQLIYSLYRSKALTKTVKVI